MQAFEKYFKIMGLPRTCTNIVEVNLVHNFNICILVHTPYWKHYYHGNENDRNGWQHNYKGKVDEETMKLNMVETVNTNYISTILCTKHPYRWLLSFYRAFGESHQSFDNFIGGYSKHYKEKTGKNVNPIELYNDLHAHFLTFYPYIIKQEDWAISPIMELQRFQRFYKLPLAYNELQIQNNHMAAGLIKYRKQYEPDITSTMEYRQMDYINKHINVGIVKSFGYNLV